VGNPETVDSELNPGLAAAMSAKKRRQAGGAGAPDAAGSARIHPWEGSSLLARRREHVPQVLANTPQWMLRTLKTSDSFLAPTMSPRRLDSTGRRQLFLRTPAANAGRSSKIGIAPFGGCSGASFGKLFAVPLWSRWPRQCFSLRHCCAPARLRLPRHGARARADLRRAPVSVPEQ